MRSDRTADTTTPHTAHPAHSSVARADSPYRLEGLAGLPNWPQRCADHKGAAGCRERKWKITQAKRLVKKAAASEKNLVLRETARQRDESQQIRRRASWVAKEVR